jgi:hypothetical protein
MGGYIVTRPNQQETGGIWHMDNEVVILILDRNPNSLEIRYYE